MQNNTPRETTYMDYIKAFLDYLGKPKTVFDIKDRSKLLVLLFITIILLQKVVKWLTN